MSGCTLGGYRLSALLGAGSMGEVTPRDEKLGRDVAIKILSRDVTSDPDGWCASSAKLAPPEPSEHLRDYGFEEADAIA
jgi:hypothetical protein